MPANTHPEFAGLDDGWTVHPQCFHCGTPTGRKTKDVCPIRTPGEVIAPALVSRMEKWDEEARFWIKGFGIISLESVASRAGAAYIGAIRWAAFCTRYPMIRFEPDRGDKG